VFGLWPLTILSSPTEVVSKCTSGVMGSCFGFPAWRSYVSRRDGYTVAEAGVPRVNGLYTMTSRRLNNAPVYTNGKGVILFRYLVRSGTIFWYLSEDGDLSRARGDFYRARSAKLSPPLDGWSADRCPLGQGTSRPVLCTCSWQKTRIGTTETVPGEDGPGTHSCREEQGNASAGEREKEGGNAAIPGVDEEAAAAENEPRVELEVVLFSGSRLATLSAVPSWTAQDIKRALRSSLQRSTVVSKLVFDGQVVNGSRTVADLELKAGSLLYAVVEAAQYLVEGAGISRVNGPYIKTERQLNEAPVYVNEYGVILFRYAMPRGTIYWYFSEDGNLSKSADDFYRVRSGSLFPPLDGWLSERCPLGCNTSAPSLTCCLDDTDVCSG